MGYSAETWAILKGCYESGTFKSLAELHKTCKKTLGSKCPSLSSLQKRCDRDGWDKHSSDEQKKEVVRKTYLEMFASAGITDEIVVGLTVKGLHAGEDLSQKILDHYIDNSGELSPQYISMVQQLHIDYRTRLKYLQEYHKLCGSYQPEKIDHKVLQKNIPIVADSMSDIEIEEELARLDRMKNARTKQT